VHVQIFFDGNISVKAQDFVNESGLAANLQFSGISPLIRRPLSLIDIGRPGNLAATFYALSADCHMNGSPDVTGAIVCKTFYGNGNTS
jgi:hypothetical protein